MADHFIRKVSQSGIGYAVVDLNEVRHIYAVATPLGEGNFEKQAEEVLRTVEGVISEQGTRGSIVRQAVYLADMAHAARCREMMRGFFGGDMPATTYIPQPPCGGRLLAVEALGVGKGQRDVEIQRISEELVVARHNGIDWAYGTTVFPHGEHGPMYDAAIVELQATCRTLAGVGTHFGQVVKTWFFLGGIREPVGARSRYQEFNRARTDFFQHEHFHRCCSPSKGNGLVYPASTDIGSAGRGASMSAIAVTTDRDDIRIVPLEIPRQTAAVYSSIEDGLESPKSSSAIVLSCGKGAMIFISGTTSSNGSRASHADNAVGQTEETLDNIAALLDEDNFARSGLPGLGSTLGGIALARVFIERAADFPAVRAACRRRLGTVPTTYTIADICHKELLVEIEGVAFSRTATA